jgi:membrane fusion protein (multidrug efflux system)
MRLRMGRKLWISGIAVGFAVGLAACGNGDAAGDAAGGGGPPGGGMPPLPVEAVTLKAQKIDAGIQTVGSLRADESVGIRPEVAGRIVRIHFTEGEQVRAGQPLFTLDSSIARATLNEAVANLENSKRTVERSGRMVEQKLIAQSDYDRAQATYGVDKARVESARTMLSKMTLSAPFSGQVGLRNVSVGEIVSPLVQKDLVTLVRLDPIEVDFSVPESALAQLKNGQKIQVTVDAFPTEVFDGQVVAIDPVIDLNSRSARLRAQVANRDGRLRPGQFAKLQLETGGNQTDSVLVPEQALMQDGSQRFVWTIVDGKAKKAIVRTGLRVPGAFQVVEGLKAGDQVITAGQTKPMMNDGLPVQVLPAGGAPGAAPAKGQPAQQQAEKKPEPKESAKAK